MWPRRTWPRSRKATRQRRRGRIQWSSRPRQRSTGRWSQSRSRRLGRMRTGAFTGRMRAFSELNTQPTDTPVQRFKCSLATALTWLGARVIRYSFPVRLLHSLLHAVYPGAIQTRGSAPRILAALPLRRALDKPRGGAQPQEYGHNRMTSLTRLSVSALLFLAPAAAQQPPLIDRELFFGDPEIAGAQISPDGKYIAFLKPLNKTRNIWVKETAAPFDSAKPITNDTKRPIAQYFWSRDGKYVLYAQDKLGDENYNVYAVNPAEA